MGKMEYNERFQQYLQAKEIDKKMIERAIEHGSRDLQGIVSLNKPTAFSLTNTIPKCKDVIQLELILRIKKYRLKRRHNNLLVTLDNEEFIDFLVHHHRQALNPGFRQSTPLLTAVLSRNVTRVRTFLLSRRCDIHSRPPTASFTILEHALADDHRPILEMIALVYRKRPFVYSDDRADSIDLQVKKMRNEMCVRQTNAKIGLLEIIKNNRGRYSVQGFLDIAMFTDLHTAVANDSLCPRLQVSATREFIRRNIS